MLTLSSPPTSSERRFPAGLNSSNNLIQVPAASVYNLASSLWNRRFSTCSSDTSEPPLTGQVVPRLRRLRIPIPLVTFYLLDLLLKRLGVED